MILYINGDSHAAAAEAVNPHAFAEDDSKYFYMGRAPHPDNWAVSWGNLLGAKLKATTHYDAESASSNQRIIRTTKDWIEAHADMSPRTLIIIGWSTWEREEWEIDGSFYQVNGSGIDHVPESHVEQYKNFIANLDWEVKTKQAHQDIWNFHLYLNQRKIQHLFFNCNNDFGIIKSQENWGNNYLGPYDNKFTFDRLLKDAGFQTVALHSWHFDKTAHAWWSSYILNYLIRNNMV